MHNRTALLPPTRRRCADLAIIGARIETFDRRRPVASAVVVKDGVVVAVGSADEARAHCDAATEVADGTGLTLTPGLVDCHHHPMWVTKFVAGVDGSDIRSAQALRIALIAERRRVGSRAVVRAWGLDYGLFGATGLNGRELERIAGGPALVTFMDCHTYLATPSVLHRAGITGPGTFQDGSQVVMRNGRPTGELREFEAFELVAAALPRPSAAETSTRVRATLRELAALGVTGVHVMDGDVSSYDRLQGLEDDEDLPLRLVVPLWVKPSTSEQEVQVMLGDRDVRGRRWRGGVAKFFIDGVVESGTAWLEQPDARGQGSLSAWAQPHRYAELVARFARAGFQCVTHAIGDRAVRETLDAYRAAPPRPGIRHRIEHLELLRDAELRRLVDEQVVASMQPLHMQWRTADGSDEWSQRLGATRAARAFRVGDLIRAGASLALGSDWPVAQRDPRVGMAWARLRREPGRTDAPVFEPTQRLSARQALAGYTTGAALAVGEQCQAGRIAPGLRADFTAFAGNPLQISGDELVQLPVALTVVAGEITHRSEAGLRR